MLKLIAMELSSRCIMQPRCPFCYLKGVKCGDDSRYEPTWAMHKIVGERLKQNNIAPLITVCLEYNGYNLDYLRHIWMNSNQPTEYTMTTMPMVVTDVFAGFIANHNIKAVALSYDEYKLSGPEQPEQWAKKAQILKNHSLKVSCNYLLTDITMNELFRSFNNDEPAPIGPIIDTADQINLLSLKPTGEYDDTDKKAIYGAIESLKRVMPVAVDNCLGIQLGYTSKCHAGDEFIHIMADGTIKSCCFEDKCVFYGKIGETDKNEVIQC
jgi:hypothetical protein